MQSGAPGSKTSGLEELSNLLVLRLASHQAVRLPLGDWRDYSRQESPGKSEWDRMPENWDERRQRVMGNFGDAAIASKSPCVTEFRMGEGLDRVALFGNRAELFSVLC